MDAADRAQIEYERQQERAQVRRKKEGPEAEGYCLECGESLSNNARWCSAKCRDAYCEPRGL